MKYTLEDLKKFYNINHKMPSSTKKGEWCLYQWLRKNKKEKDVSEFLESINKKPIYTIKDLISFYNINHRLPNSNKKGEGSLYNWMNRNRNNSEIQNFFKENKIKSLKYTIDSLIHFYEINNRLPKNIKSERCLYRWVYRNKDNIDVSRFLKSIKEESISYKLIDLIEFCDKNNRLPQKNKDDELDFYNWVYKNKSNFDIQRIIFKYNKKSERK